MSISVLPASEIFKAGCMLNAEFREGNLVRLGLTPDFFTIFLICAFVFSDYPVCWRRSEQTRGTLLREIQQGRT